MSASKNLIQAAAGVGGGSGPFYDYEIENSARFTGSETLYRAQTTPTDNRKWTFSCWFKWAGSTASWRGIIGAGTSGSDYTNFYMNGTHWLLNHVSYGQMDTSAFYRDPSAWYHVVVAFDSTQASAGDRQKIWVNGVLEAQTYSYGAWPQNFNTNINKSGYTLRIGRSGEAASYSTQYLAECVFIDGQQLDPTNFAETKNGVWVPTEITGLTFGNNGFHLKFDNSGSLGADSSGNGNNFTPSGLTSSDQMIDTPTSNFCTLNPLDGAATAQVNLQQSARSSSWATCQSTMAFPKTGKWYWEAGVFGSGTTDTGTIGVSADPASSYVGSTTNSFSYLGANGYLYQAAGAVPYGATYGANDIIGILWDADNGDLTFYKNGASQGVAKSGLDTSIDYRPAVSQYNAYVTNVNFGQNGTFNNAITAGGNTDANGIGDFKYTVPTDALALCTANLPEPTIGPNSATTSDENFYVGLYTGTGAELAITGLPFSPDKVAIKNRDAGNSWRVFDRLRGATNQLFYDTATAQTTSAQGLKSFDANGFTLGTDGPVNGSGNDFVFYSYKGKGSGVSNTDGSITSTVSVNQDAGISFISYTGNATAGATIGHGLGAIPKIVIAKSVTSISNWLLYTEMTGATNAIVLDTSDALFTNNATWWNNTAPDSSVVTLGSGVGSNSPNASIAYCFAEVEGFSSFGSYTGNGSTDGPFIYTGFRPAYLVIKRTDAAASWNTYDTKRSPYNPMDKQLFLDLPNADNTTSGGITDALSNGVKLRGTGSTTNASGGTYIYMAFAENPFKYSNAR